MTPTGPADLVHPSPRHSARQTASRLRKHGPVADPSVSGRQAEKRPFASSKIMDGTAALHSEPPSLQYASWTSARRRAWDRRFSNPWSYFYHYCHPKFDSRIGRWSLQEHCLFLSAISRIPPTEKNWPVVSLLVPGRTGSDCRRYYHRIGRAGLITVKGTMRKRLFCRASISTFDDDGKKKGRLSSSNPLFRKSALRRFLPSQLPPIDDSLLKPFKSQSVPLSKERFDALTHIPTQFEEYDKRKVDKKSVTGHLLEEKPVQQKRKRMVPCRLPLRSSSEHTDITNSLINNKKDDIQTKTKKHVNSTVGPIFGSCGRDGGKNAMLSTSRPTVGKRKGPRPSRNEGGICVDSSKAKSKRGKSAPRDGQQSRPTLEKNQHLANDSTNEDGPNMPDKPLTLSQLSTPSDVKDVFMRSTVSREPIVSEMRSERFGARNRVEMPSVDRNLFEGEASSLVNDTDSLEKRRRKAGPSSPRNNFESRGGQIQFCDSHGASTGDVEDPEFVMDMAPSGDLECSSHQIQANLEINEAGKIGQGNKKRVVAPTSSERASISFLVNNDDHRPETKEARVEETRFSGSLRNGRSSELDKLEEIGLLLRLFAETVDETGKTLGHHFERSKLLQRYNEYVALVRSGVKERPLFHAARLTRPIEEREIFTYVPKESLGCSRCLGDNIDNWRQQVNDMMERQNAEVTSAQRIARVMHL
ncbi:Myb-like DNA-binding [Gracilaria domingensis]|nr:Myb-like DNA-binding [Gracilaria domingensis]